MEQVCITTDGNMSIVRCGSVYICATGLKPITEQSVTEYIAYTNAIDARLGVADGVIQYSPTQSPSSAQRKRFATEQKIDGFKRVAILTESTLVRGAILAMSWLSKGKTETRAFKPGDHEESVAWICGLNVQRDEAQAALVAVVANVGLPRPK